MIRRPFYGGGTAFYGEGCAATWAFLLPKAGPDATGESLDDRLARYQPVVLDFLARLGLSAVQFEGSSDLRINGRKLGALTAQDIVACDCVGGFVNLSKPDLDLYLSVARVPDEKFKDKVVKDLREYVDHRGGDRRASRRVRGFPRRGAGRARLRRDRVGGGAVHRQGARSA